MEMITKTIDPIADEVQDAGFAWRERGGVRILVCTALERDGFANAFSTRVGGVSPLPDAALNLAGFDDDAAANIRENRRRFLQLVGGNWNLLTVHQVHGNEIQIVRAGHAVEADAVRADALATNVPKILLGVKTADCVPVILGDARTGACAAVHAGWRGTLAGIVRRAVEMMRSEFGAEP
ncbi:MAG TPA: laccase domain-containing protein, partial [Pyrinomonadaceae bacterium]|nr:laccase domain-containing protein [Pyrinomonadaceae bacterium]